MLRGRFSPRLHSSMWPSFPMAMAGGRPPGVCRARQAISDSEAATAKGTRLHLRLAVDYSAREAIYHAACRFYKVTELSPESFSNVLAEVHHGGSTEVDLLIRTGGDQRLSDFLLWECAFAELVFVQKRWPDFTAASRAAGVKSGQRFCTNTSSANARAG